MSDSTRAAWTRNPADPTATIVAPWFDIRADSRHSQFSVVFINPAEGLQQPNAVFVVCLLCYGELRSWRPEMLEAFRAWHRDKCGRLISERL